MKQLSSPLQQYWPTVVERLPEAISESSLSVQAKSVLTFSDFVRDSIIAHPEWLAELESTPPADEWQHYANWLQQALADVSDEHTLMRELRLFRRRIMVRIARAQTLSLVTEESILQQLSHLAETLIVAARDWLYAACCREWGTPCNPEGAQPLLILGMGKLGGGELNFSSDIDLIFARRNTAAHRVGVASWITRSSLPVWASGLSKCWISPQWMGLSIGWICVYARLATAARWC